MCCVGNQNSELAAEKLLKQFYDTVQEIDNNWGLLYMQFELPLGYL